MSDSRLTAGAIYRAVLLAFGLIVAGMIVQQLMSILLAVLIVIVIALPLSAFATALSSRGCPERLERFSPSCSGWLSSPR
jgi:hypothetical protein